MKLSGEIALASGFIFDYSNMINTDTITPAVIETLESKAKDAADALLLIREQGMGYIGEVKYGQLFKAITSVTQVGLIVVL